MDIDPEVTEVPRGNWAGFVKYFQQDLQAGLMVFLIALPLCLGIAIASGFPPIAGILTAIVGAILTTFLSNSELTIKGPAAGLIVIVLGCVNDFGGTDSVDAYRATLAVGVAAAVLQILFGLFRAGILGEFFPASAVHGMLAAIGVIIIIKQIPVALGVQDAGGEPLEMLLEFPQYVLESNPAIALIGTVSILIMFVWPVLAKRLTIFHRLPAPLVVLLVAIPIGIAFGITGSEPYMFHGHTYPLGEQYLVRMPDRMFGMFDEITLPSFAVLAELKAWKWVLMFFLIGSLESLLSAKAIDLLDPWKRKSNLNRDIAAVGVANLVASGIGGLPMISEIVRSKANIDNGARTRFANMWHGLFLFACVALIPGLLHTIPLAALAGMLVYTGFRLAHPRQLVEIYHIGREQLVIFVVTLFMVLATDLLIGVASGILLKFVFHVANGVPIKTLFRPGMVSVEEDSDTVVMRVRGSAIFSNWIAIRLRIEREGLSKRRNVVLDVSETHMVDHSVIEKLEEMKRDFSTANLSLTVRGLDALQPIAGSHHSARKRGVIS